MSQPFNLDGKSYPRLGMAIDSEESSRRESRRVSLYIVRVTSFTISSGDRWAYFQQVNSLEDKFGRLV
jgi:hypothetical protein